MKSRRNPRLIAVCAALATCAFARTALAVPGGELHTLAVGHWVCELPGDATTQPVRRAVEDFWAIEDSSYRVRGAGESPGGRGSYVLLGDRLTMTSGPFEGRRYAVDSAAMVHPLGANGNPLAMRCVKSGTPSAFVEAAPATSSATNPTTPAGH